MNAPRVCCIVSGLLGNARLSERLVDAVELATGSRPQAAWFSEATYTRYGVPALLRFSEELEAELVVRRMLAHEGLPEADVYVVNTYQVALASRRFNPDATWIVATDATPRLTARLRAEGYAERPSRARLAFRRWQDSRFLKFAPTVDAWLPISSACRDSLVQDYSVAAERCYVTSAPQAEVDVDLPGRDPTIRPWRLLFVGNDFARKGGRQLCDAMAHLPEAHLTVVSRDPSATAFAGERVRILSDIEDPRQLAGLYRGAHLLVHPTLVDHYSNVICEALARGLPFLVTEQTPAAELAELSGAGRRLSFPPSGKSIAAAVRSMLEDRVAYAIAERRALEFSAAHLTQARFASLLNDVLRVRTRFSVHTTGRLHA